jgi:hypothetical protein
MEEEREKRKRHDMQCNAQQLWVWGGNTWNFLRGMKSTKEAFARGTKSMNVSCPSQSLSLLQQLHAYMD